MPENNRYLEGYTQGYEEGYEEGYEDGVLSVLSEMEKNE